MKESMELNIDDAFEAMGDGRDLIRFAIQKMVGSYLLLWGAIYFLVPLLIQWTPGTAVWTTNGLVVVGIIGSIIMGKRTPVRSQLDSRIGIFWFVAFAFAFVWVILLGGENHPRLEISLNGRQTWALGVTVAMMVFVLMGLVFGSRMMLALGIGVTILTLAAFLVEGIWNVFWYWMALCNGLPLLTCGLWAKMAKGENRG